jgi:uncharacterized protein (DUF427 family)
MTEVLAPPSRAEAFRAFEDSPRRVRTYLNGVPVADSTHMKLLLEKKRLPQYYFPREDVNMDLLVESDKQAEDENKGPATYYHVKVGDQTAENAAVAYLSPPEGAPDVSGHIQFDWNSMEAWFEEDDQIYKHARDPYKRIDVLNSSRHIEIKIDGVTVADTHRPRLLFETGLPTRFYVPKLDVDMELLTPTETHSVCPYKGTASYYSVTVDGKTYDDYVWTYPLPIPECPKVENLLCFYNEKVDVYVDGELQERPKTNWS